MSSITPYSIAVPDDKIKRLKQKLALTDFPNETADIEPWSQGSPLSEIKRLAIYWEKKFSWRTVEARLNKLPQYTAKINVDGFDTYEVHFIHQPSTVKTAIPLLFAHGWPGSFVEVTKILPELIKGGVEFPAFHVVAPSLVDYGFSSASQKKAFNIDQNAEVCHKIMLALGYNEYVVQGGDWGYAVARLLALKYGPKHVKAHHVNNTLPAEPTATANPVLYAKVQTTPLSDREKAGLGRTEWFSKEGNGYYKLQTTKPQTIGYAITDSPVGLLAWIYEKLHDWTDDYKWTDDEILTWISIYYFSKAGPAASGYIYYNGEHRDPPIIAATQAYSEVPLGISRFPKDLIVLPKLWDQALGPIVFEKEHERGGHFAAWERPDAVIDDLRTMFGKSGGAFNVVKGKSGFLVGPSEALGFEELAISK